MPPVGFEPTISAGERPKTYALDRAATGTGIHTHTHTHTEAFHTVPLPFWCAQKIGTQTIRIITYNIF